MTSSRPTLVWFRQDLRLRDQPALAAAVERGAAVVPVFVWDEAGEGRWAPGGASRWWLHHSLAALGDSLRERGGRLILRRGNSLVELQRLVKETGAEAVYWNRRYEPAIRQRDTEIKSTLLGQGLDVQSFNAALLHEPHTVANRAGGPFQVFSPYWRTCLGLSVPAPVARVPREWPTPARWPATLTLDELELMPAGAWTAKLERHWRAGEATARKSLRRFVSGAIDDYDRLRDAPAAAATSRLSPHLHFGEIGPRQVWAAVKARGAATGVFPASKGARVFLSELGWREFGYHLLYHFPHLPERPLRPEFRGFPWRHDPGGQLIKAWQDGRTGYPIVDAGMRELWATGWMHNRARMIVGSFLVKHLRQPWQEGAAWFWETLVDADLANNTLGWQWISGCGADAAPYFRIFNPMTQGAKFDSAGHYVRRWVPELAGLAGKWIHAPWQAPDAELQRAGVSLGDNYPRPIVDHATARAEALTAFHSFRAHTALR